MTTATLSSPSVTQLTFPWASALADEQTAIVAEHAAASAPTMEFAAPTVAEPEVAASLREALVGDRIGQPFRMGNVMFRLLRSYGITDEEIAAGVAAYNAKRARRG